MGGLYFLLLMKSHLQSYPCPLQINFFWNFGFLLGVAIILQIITGIFLGFWRILCLQSNIKEVLHFSLHSSISSLWFCNSSSFYLHFLSSNNPLRNSTNNKIPFFPFIFQKDFFGLILVLCLYLL